ncbi:MAG: hypothetical protein KF858_06250 [Candidatus Sumerlaeia bacterium]|nr:hypothetical protein [Candidatus Sumerlaeia bacterium]
MRLSGWVLCGLLVGAPLVGVAETTAPAWVGVVDGKAGYRIVEAAGTEGLPVHGAKVRVGDRVLAGERSVVMRLPESAMVLIGNGSSVRVAGERQIALEGGSVATGFRVEKPVELQFDTLGVAILKPEPAAEAGPAVVPTATAARSAVLGIDQLSPGSIRISAFNEMASVRLLESGTQLAVVGANQVLELVQDALGNWTLADAIRSQEAETTGETSDRRDESGALVQQGGANAGAGAGIGVGTGTGIAVGTAGLVAGVYGLKKADDNKDDVDDLKDEIEDLEDQLRDLEDVLRSLTTP